MSSEGKFVTLEGIEGAGKSQQLQRLQQRLRLHQIPFLCTMEPGGTPFGREVRSIVLQSDGPQREPVAELLLYLADRYQHLKEVIEPALREGKLVVSDRYHDATMAYQGYARGLGFDFVERLSSSLRLRRPDLTVVLDLDVEVGLGRARRRNREEKTSDHGRFEEEDLHFHQLVREGYRELSLREPDRVVLLDASGDSGTVFDLLWDLLLRRGIVH